MVLQRLPGGASNLSGDTLGSVLALCSDLGSFPAGGHQPLVKFRETIHKLSAEQVGHNDRDCKGYLFVAGTLISSSRKA